jgi:HK97 family phage major capsid protein
MADILKALNEATNSSGGFTVPLEYSNQMLALVQQQTMTMDDLDVRQMNSDVMYIPKVTGGTTAYWIAESGAMTESATQYGQITLTAKKIASLTMATSEVLEDNNVDLANHLLSQMSKDLALTIDGAVLTGSCATGSNSIATAAPFFGLYHTASYTNAVDALGNANQTGAWGTGATLTGTGMTVKAVASAVTEVLKDNFTSPDVSYWNPRTIGTLMMLTDSTTRPVFDQVTYGSPMWRDGVLGRIYGTNVKSNTQVPVNLAYGTTAALLACSDALVGVSKQYGIFGNRRGYIWKTFYDISKDIYEWQTTARMAFATKYPNSYCLIRAISN